MDLMASMNISGSAMRAQSMRMKVLSENLANANSAINEDGTGPYRRQLVYLESTTDPATGATGVKVSRVQKDYTTPLKAQYDPSNPLADERGFVMMPNVDSTIEKADMREAARAYEASLSAIDTAKGMMTRSLDLLR